MAILHSRFARVFYGTDHRTMGALGTKTKLHCIPSLNHRFKVYKGLLRDQCAALWQKQDGEDEGEV